MSRKMLVLALVLWCAACNGSGNPFEVDYATICVYARTMSDDLIDAQITMNGEPFVGDCKRIEDLSISYTFNGSAKDYQASPFTVPAGELHKGETWSKTMIFVPDESVDPDARATVCVETVRENGDYVAASVYLDGNEMFGCASLNPTLPHTISFGEVAGLKPPDSIGIPAGELADGEKREYKRVYTEDIRAMLIRTVDTFGSQLNGEIFVDGRFVGTGEYELEYDAMEPHTISFGEIDGYTSPSDWTLDPSVSVYLAKYLKPGAAKVCFNTVNEQGQRVDTKVVVNAVEVPGYPHCTSMAVEIMNKVEVNEDIAGYMSPRHLYIPPNVLKEDEEREFDLVFLPSESVQYLNVGTTPVLGEIFVDGRSVGWSTPEQFARFIVSDTSSHTISFGAVDGIKTPDPIELTLEQMYDPNSISRIFGFYGDDEYALVCAWAKSPYDQWIRAKVRVDDDVMLETAWGDRSCWAVDPNTDHTLTWFASDDENLATPRPTEISAEELEVGEEYKYIGEYVRGGQQRMHYRVRILFMDPWGYPMKGKAEWDGYSMQGMEESIYFDAGESATITFLKTDDSYTLDPPDPMTFDDSLSESDPEYDPENDEWVYEASYTASTSSTRVCIEAFNGNGLPASPGARFDGYDSLSWDEVCQALPMNQPHTISPSSLSGHTTPREIFIPAGKLSEGEVTYTVQYIMNAYLANVWMDEIPVTAEVKLNGNTLGWTAAGNRFSIMMDTRYENTVSFSDAAGFGLVEPEMTFPAYGDRDQQVMNPYVPLDQHQICVTSNLNTTVYLDGDQRGWVSWDDLMPFCLLIDPTIDNIIAVEQERWNNGRHLADPWQWSYSAGTLNGGERTYIEVEYEQAP